MAISVEIIMFVRGKYEMPIFLILSARMFSSVGMGLTADDFIFGSHPA